MSLAKWFSDELELLDDCAMDSVDCTWFDDFTPTQLFVPAHEGNLQLSSLECNTFRDPTFNPRSIISTTAAAGSSSEVCQASSERPTEQVISKASKGTQKANMMSRSPSQANHHVLAERKRREKLSDLLISLSAIVPGLKKLDKAYILEETAKYMKQLQGRANSLEEQIKLKHTESVVLVKSSKTFADHTTTFTSPVVNTDCNWKYQLPEVLARVSGDNVLIKIQCEKDDGCLLNILCEIEKLHLRIVSSSALPFGDHAMDVTVVAQMDAQFLTSAKNLANSLRSAILS